MRPNYAPTRDGTAGRELLPQAIEQFRKDNGASPDAAAGERALRALAMLADGKPAEAIPLLEPVTFDDRHAEQVSVWTIAQLQSENWTPAIKGLTLMIGNQRRGFDGTKAPAMVWLARAQVALGQRDEARKSYQAFFDFWKNADPDVPLLLQAHDEFGRLR